MQGIIGRVVLRGGGGGKRGAEREGCVPDDDILQPECWVRRIFPVPKRLARLLL